MPDDKPLFPRDPLSSDPVLGGHAPADAEPLTTEEREELAARIREDLEREHSGRLDRVQRWREGVHRGDAARTREAELAHMREEMRAAFYQEKGYVRITEAGRDRWVSPEEAAWRSKRRRSGKPSHKPMNGRQSLLPFYVLAVLVAIALGVLLVR